MLKNPIKFLTSQTIVCFLLCLSFIFIVYEIRSDFRGELYGKYADNSAHTITSTKIWYEEGPQNISFGSILSRKSVQYKNLDTTVHERHIGGLTFPTVIDGYLREVYISYPTAYLVPLYLTSVMKGAPPSEADLYLVNNMVSLILLFTLCLMLISLTKNKNNVISTLIVVASLTSAGFIYFYQIFLSYNSLGAVYFALYLYLRLINRNNLSLTILFIGLLTDYLFFFIVVTQVLLNLVSDKKISQDTIKIFLISVICAVIFCLQLYSLGVLEHIIWKFQFRMGMVDSIANGKVIKDKGQLNIIQFVFLYGYNTVKVLGPSMFLFPFIFVFLMLKQHSRHRKLLFLATIPPLLYTFTLRSSSVHEYEVLKFIPASILVLGLFVNDYLRRKCIFVIALFLVNAINLYFWFPSYIPPDATIRHNLNQFIKSNTTDDDLIFKIEPKIEIWNGNLSFNLAPYMWWRDYPYRQRNVNHVSSFEDALLKTKAFDVPAKRYLLIVTNDEKQTNKTFQDLVTVASIDGFFILDFGSHYTSKDKF